VNIAIAARYSLPLVALGLVYSACTRDLQQTEAVDSVLDQCPDEVHANDTPEEATAVKLGVPLPACIGNDDVDYYVVKVPVEDRAGGYFKVSVTDVGKTGLAQIQSEVDSDMAPLLTNVYGNNRGGPTFGYWTGAPGQTYRISIAQFSTWIQPWSYTLQIDYTPIKDTFEPNDTPDDAQPIRLGDPVEGYVFTGHAKGPIRDEAWDDWYEVELQPGTVTMKVTSFPRDAIADLGLLDPAGASIRPGPQPYAANRGADHMASAKITVAGTYKLRLGVFSTPPSTAGKLDVDQSVPDSFTRPYQLVVTQP
jgi:hypothetical protein